MLKNTILLAIFLVSSITFADSLTRIHPKNTNFILGEAATPLGGDSDPARRSTVLIYSKNELEQEAICSGAVISHRHILTAGHCFEHGLKPKKIKFDDGFLFSSTRKPVGVKRLTQDMTWENTSFPNNVDDIAIVLFKGGLPSSARVAFISRTKPDPGEKILISGFGISEPFEEGDQTLRKLEAEMISDRSVFNLLMGWSLISTAHAFSGIPDLVSFAVLFNADKYDELFRWLKNGTLFAADTDKPYGWVGPGDSGGPLYQEVDGKMKIVGVTSFGPKKRYLGSKIIAHPIFSANLFSRKARDFIQKETGKLY